MSFAEEIERRRASAEEARASSDGDYRPSFGGSIFDLGKGLAGGIANLAVQGVNTARNLTSPTETLKTLVLTRAGAREGGLEGAWEGLEQRAPLVTEGVESIDRSAQRLPYWVPMGAGAVLDWAGADSLADTVRERGSDLAHAANVYGHLRGVSRDDARELQDDIRYRPLLAAVEDIGNVAIVAGGASSAIGGAARQNALRATTRSRVLTNQADEIVEAAAQEVAPLRTAREAAAAGGNQARVRQLDDVIEQVMRKADADAAPLRAQARALLDDAQRYNLSTRGQLTGALDRVSGAANRYDPTNYIAYTGYRLGRQGAQRLGQGIRSALEKLPETNAIRRGVLGAGEGLNRFVRSRLLRREMAEIAASDARRRTALSQPVRKVAERMVKDLPDVGDQTVASIAAFGEADLFIRVPELARLIDEGSPAAQRYLDDVFYARVAPGEQVPTLAQVKEAMDLRRGRLTPERAAQLQAGVRAWHEMGELLDQQYLKGAGESVAPTPDELYRRSVEDVGGRGPRESVVERRVAPYRQKADQAAERAAQSAARADEAALRFDERYGTRPQSSAQIGRHVADQGATHAEIAKMSEVERRAMSRERTMAAARQLAKDADTLRAQADALVEGALEPRARTDAQAFQAGRRAERFDQRARDLRAQADALDAQLDQLVDDIIAKELGNQWQRVDNGRERAAYLRRKAELTESFRPERTEGATRPGELTDATVERAQRWRQEADYLDRKAELTEAFAPDPASARGKAMDALMRRGARDGAEMARQLARVEQLAREAAKDARSAAAAQRQMDRITDAAMKSVEAAPPAYQPLMFRLRELRRTTQQELRTARMDFAEELISANPALARRLAGKGDVTAQNISRSLARAETRLRNGQSIGDDVRGALDSLYADRPDLVSSQQILAEASLGVQALVDAGIEPAFATGGYVSPQSRASGRIASSGSVSPTISRLARENQKTMGVMPRTAEQAMQLHMREVRKGVQNETARRLIGKYGVIVDDVVRELSQAGESISVTLDSGQVVTYGPGELGNLKGPALVRAMEQRGLVALDTSPMASDQFILSPRRVNSQTVFVPEEVATAFQREWAQMNEIDLFLSNTYDRITSQWKNATLALSPRWWLNNTVGNAVMLTAGGSRPWDAAQAAVQARRLMRQLKETGELPIELFDVLEGDAQIRHGIIQQNQLRNTLSDNAVVRTGQRAVRGSYAINQYVDNMYRLTLYLERRGRGFNHAQAVRDSLKVFGDYQRMTRFERTVARRLFSFYSWTRTITRFAMSLPVEHPVRTAWLATIADRYGDGEDMPGFVRGIPMGNLLFRSASADPFGQIMEEGLAPETYLSGANPFLQMGYSFVSPGDRLGGGDVYLPPGTDPGALDTRFRVLREDLYNLTPHSRAIRAADGIRRYSDGTPRLEGGRYARREQWDGPLGTLPYVAEEGLRILGVPYPVPYDRDREVARDRYYRAQDERARQRYQARLRGAS